MRPQAVRITKSIVFCGLQGFRKSIRGSPTIGDMSGTDLPYANPPRQAMDSYASSSASCSFSNSSLGRKKMKLMKINEEHVFLNCSFHFLVFSIVFSLETLQGKDFQRCA